MDQFTYDEISLKRNGKRWFPMMGEFHYSRYPEKYWKESLYKMKAGGIDIVSTYVIWIHHEEEEQVFDFSGQRNLREFVRQIQECGMYCFLRIGPWVHAEVRNGGFPDWLKKKGWDLRSDDERYLQKVKILFQKIAEQVQGLLLKDGGSIIGIQIENEYGHAGGYTGEKGEQHMKTLLNIAKDVGLDVPLYTATGWGGAVLGGMLPVMGGYCDAPWDRSVEELPPNENYVFLHKRNDENIGNDYGKKDSLTFDPAKYPFLTAELGGGLQVTHHRRPVAVPDDTGAMSLVKMGSGCNLLGYYMYHGGVNPNGKYTMLNETFASGGYNDLPLKNYDFNAPIGAYGQCGNAYGEIRRLSMFVHDFGEEFCSMKTDIPEESSQDQNDLQNLRFCVRHDGERGSLFVNNYQRRYAMADHENVKFSIVLDNEKIVFPEITVHDQEYFFFPVNMKLEENAVLKYIAASPLCKLNNERTTYVFYGDHIYMKGTERKGNAPVLLQLCDRKISDELNICLEGELQCSEILHISDDDSRNAQKIVLDQEYLIISESEVVPECNEIHLIGSAEKAVFYSYPKLTDVPKGFQVTELPTGLFCYEREIEEVEYSDVFLQINYAGDGFQFFVDGKLVYDHFYTGQLVEIGMKQYKFSRDWEIKVIPYHRGMQGDVFLEKLPPMKNDVACEMISVDERKEWDIVL